MRQFHICYLNNSFKSSDFLQVINLNPPSTYEQYVHRVGRTARAGASGKAVTIINESVQEEREILENVKKFSKGQLARRNLVDGKILCIS